jgi:hypothetical protein
MIGTLPKGTRGIDLNNPLIAKTAQQFAAKGFKFVMRYIRRSQAHSYDISEYERDVILGAGMGLGIVQHVAPPGWTPTGDLGVRYGQVALLELERAKIPLGVSVALDLEGVAKGAPADGVVKFCNNWFDQVRTVGYQPLLYVGDSPGLSAHDLYAKLKFRAYWGAYNLNSDAVPEVRGLQMRQGVAKESDWIPGFNSQNMDIDVVGVDALGGTPFFLLP